MTIPAFKYIRIVLGLAASTVQVLDVVGQSARIEGQLSIDDTWERTIYISHIPSMEEMHHMSNKMIIAQSEIDSTNHFSFDLDFLPEEDHLYRLHLVKKGDSPASLVIGGRNENHLFLMLNRSSQIELKSAVSRPPFRHITFYQSNENNALHQIARLVHRSDSIAGESSASKRTLIEEQLQRDLLLIADTSKHLLVSLYALHHSNFASEYASRMDYYQSYIEKWGDQENDYFHSFTKEFQAPGPRNYWLVIGGLILLILVLVTWIMRRSRLGKSNRNIEKLSIQEKKVYQHLLQGASNQEIANQLKSV